MTMEEYIAELDTILTQINEPTLTDDEILTIKPIDPLSLQEEYETLYTILQIRGGGQSLRKLKSNAEVNNITIGSPKKDYNNMIFAFGVNNTEGLK